MIGTANSLTGVLAPFELAINGGMEVAADEINAAGGVDGAQDQDHPRRREIGPQPVGDRRPRRDREGRRRSSCRSATPTSARPAHGRRTRRASWRSPAQAHPASAGRWSARSPSTRTRAHRRRARSTPNTRTTRWAGAARISSAIACSSTRRSCARRSRRAGRASAGRSWARTPSSRATSRSRSQVTRLVNGPKPDFVMLASFPGGSPAIKEIRAAYDGPIMLSAAYSGTFWLKATPHLSNAWVAAVGSSYGDDPRNEVNAFFRKYKAKTGKAAGRRHLPAARLLARPDDREGHRDRRHDRRQAARQGARDVQERAPAGGADDLHAGVPRSRQAPAPDHPLRQTAGRNRPATSCGRRRFRPTPAEQVSTLAVAIRALDGACQLDA